jgi:ParB family chromosome partitioning protein
MMTNPNDVQEIPVEAITVLNPRVRNRRGFADLVASVASVGLKKPITVRVRPGGASYDLVCGQGRLEASIELGQLMIPAIVIEASEEECYVRSLVENLARRQHKPMELLREIETLRTRGYTYAEIAQKTGLSPEYVHAIAGLLEKGEIRLLKAVEQGLVPHSIAIEIARAEEGEVQAALTEAYENKTLPGNQVVAIRRIIELRKVDGKGSRREGRVNRNQSKHVTAGSLVRAYTKEMNRQKLQVRKADLASDRLVFVVNALRQLLADRNFETLLRAVAMPTMPKQLAERVAADR